MEKGAIRHLRIFVHCTLMALALWPAAVLAGPKPGHVGKTARPVEVERIDVLDFGIYLGNNVASRVIESGLTQHTVNDVQLVVSTDTVPAQLGTKFGFRYTVEGKPADGVVTLKQVIIFPPQGVVSPTAGVLHTISYPTKNQIGTVLLGAGYDITEPWEQVPGPWTIQVWFEDRKLAEHTFSVVEPDAAARDSSLPVN